MTDLQAKADAAADTGWGPISEAPRPRYRLGDHVTKRSGSHWSGRIVGTYSTSLTPIGYAVESDHHPGSVQIYPEAALMPTPPEGALVMTNPNTAPVTREERMIVIRRDADDRPTVWCDPEIADLVDALNTYTLGTVASCCGHGKRPGTISLRDGRQLMVFENEEHAAAAQAAYPVDINGDTSPTAPLQARVEELERALIIFAVLAFISYVLTVGLD